MRDADRSKFGIIRWMGYVILVLLGVCVMLVIGYVGAMLWHVGTWIWRIFFSDDPWGND